MPARSPVICLLGVLTLSTAAPGRGAPRESVTLVQDLDAVFNKARANGQRIACQSNMKNLALAIRMYTADHKGQLPDHRKLVQELKSYIKNAKVWRCGSAQGEPPHFRMNSKCQGNEKSLADKAGTILLFECDAKGRPEHRHSGGINVAFVDGHVKHIAKEALKPGMWTPKAGD